MQYNSDTIVLVNLFESFCNKWINIRSWFCKLFFFAPGYHNNHAWSKTKVEFESMTDANMLLMLKKSSEVECAIPYIIMQKPTTSTWKIMTKVKNLHITCTAILASCMDEQCHKNCMYPDWNGEKTIAKTVVKGTSSISMWSMPRLYANYTTTSYSYPQGWRLINVKSRV